MSPEQFDALVKLIDAISAQNTDTNVARAISLTQKRMDALEKARYLLVESETASRWDHDSTD